MRTKGTEVGLGAHVSMQEHNEEAGCDSSCDTSDHAFWTLHQTTLQLDADDGVSMCIPQPLFRVTSMQWADLAGQILPLLN